MDSLVFNTVIALVFIFAAFSLTVSGVVEGLTRLVGLRAEFLLRGVSSMLDADTKFDKNWLRTLVTAADDAQAAATRPALDKARDKLASQGDAVFDADAIGATLESAHALMEEIQSRKEAADAAVTTAEEAVASAQGANALAAAEQDLRAAKSARANALVADPVLLLDANAKLEAAKIVLATERARIPMLPTAEKRDPLLKLELARELLSAAELAVHEAASGRLSAVSVVSVMQQPVVELTAALEVPMHLRRVVPPMRWWKVKRRLPSYLSARTFSQALLHTLVAPEGGQTTIAKLRASVDTIANPELKRVLIGHLDTAGATVSDFRAEIEKWYDDRMDRVSGWYKRHTRWYVFVVAALLAVILNVNAVSMAQAFYTDEALRDSVVTLAFETADCQADAAETDGAGTDPPEADSGKTPEQCLEDVRSQIDGLGAAGLPIGWGEEAFCRVDGAKCTWADKAGLTNPDNTGRWSSPAIDFLLVLFGWLIIALTALLGARFWVDVLSKLNTIRSAGKKPAPTNT